MWRTQRRLADDEALKSADEWLLDVRRFEDLVGTKPVTAITTRGIRAFRDLCFKLPFRVRKNIKTLPAKEQIAVAAMKKLPTLSAPSVGTHVAAIKILLSIAKEYEWVPANVAEGVIVEGARHTGIERDHFNDEEMAAAALHRTGRRLPRLRSNPEGTWRAWPFEGLKSAKYGDRHSYMSRIINDELRRLGITATDTAFYSTRHSTMREGRRRRISDHTLDQAATRAHLA